MRRRNGFTLIELMVVMAIVAIVGAMIIQGIQKFRNGGGGSNGTYTEEATEVHVAPNVTTTDDDAAYKAWVKVTDNPKGLTFDEWKNLKAQGLLPTGPAGNTTPIPIPMNAAKPTTPTTPASQ